VQFISDNVNSLFLSLFLSLSPSSSFFLSDDLKLINKKPNNITITNKKVPKRKNKIFCFGHFDFPEISSAN
jgi:penicillin-binding protein-related factor A (putative recombinase)